MENEPIQKKLLNSDTLKILAILSVTGGTGTAGTFAYQSAGTLDSLYNEIKETQRQVREVREDQIEVKSILTNALEPRIKTLESEVVNMREDLRVRTSDRFDKLDGRELKKDLENRIERLEKEIDNLQKLKGQLSNGSQKR